MSAVLRLPDDAPVQDESNNSNKQKREERQEPAAAAAAALAVKADYLDINVVPPHRGTFNFLSN